MGYCWALATTIISMSGMKKKERFDLKGWKVGSIDLPQRFHSDCCKIRLFCGAFDFAIPHLFISQGISENSSSDTRQKVIRIAVLIANLGG